MEEIILETLIKKDRDYLYFCKTSKEGYLILCRTKRSKGLTKEQGAKLREKRKLAKEEMML
jgi:hypothetical protein